MESLHSISFVERSTGLSSHVIRSWENRYQAVQPGRSEGNQRLYSDADIRRLKLLAKAVEMGESIGRIARLPDADLRQIVGTVDAHAGLSSNRQPAGSAPPSVAEALTHVESANRAELQRVLVKWLYTYGIGTLTDQLIPQLLERIGLDWEEGEIRIYHEHLATETIRSFLAGVFSEVRSDSNGKSAITATPPGEMHEIGALLCAITAASEGFEVFHLGSDVPIPEIIQLANVREPSAVMLSIVLESQNEQLLSGLQSLRDMIDPETRIYIGGRSAKWYSDHVDRRGIEYLSSLTVLRILLKELIL